MSDNKLPSGFFLSLFSKLFYFWNSFTRFPPLFGEIPNPDHLIDIKSGGNNLRTLRVTDSSDSDSKSQDFVIPAFCLKVSEIWEPMSESNDILVTEDNVIPLHDSVEAVDSLVAWMTRRKGFEINTDNYKGLAVLSDKYFIESLQTDIRNFSQKLVLRQDPPTFDLWKFAARYSLIELEEYCRSNTLVIQEIKQILCDPARGLSSLLSDGTPTLVLEGVIRKIVQLPTMSRYNVSEVYDIMAKIQMLRVQSAEYEEEAKALEERLFAG